MSGCGAAGTREKQWPPRGGQLRRLLVLIAVSVVCHALMLAFSEYVWGLSLIDYEGGGDGARVASAAAASPAEPHGHGLAQPPARASETEDHFAVLLALHLLLLIPLCSLAVGVAAGFHLDRFRDMRILAAVLVAMGWALVLWMFVQGGMRFESIPSVLRPSLPFCLLLASLWAGLAMLAHLIVLSIRRCVWLRSGRRREVK
jgi:hypothetical protein